MSVFDTVFSKYEIRLIASGLTKTLHYVGLFVRIFSDLCHIFVRFMSYRILGFNKIIWPTYELRDANA